MCNDTPFNTVGLRARNDLCVVDGIVYDLKSFAPSHPGGEVILSNGGSDASALYHSMHMGADPLKSELLQKHRVGLYTQTKGLSLEVPTYVYDTPFAKDLQSRVRKVMGTKSWYAPPAFWARLVFIAGMTALAEVRWITTGAMLWGTAAGVFHALIGLSIQHDGSHGAISRRPLVNAIMAYGADIIGNSRWIWLQQHIMWHHPYTNHMPLDGDAQSAEPALLFHDYSLEKLKTDGVPFRWYHRYQALYMNLVLAMYGPSITLNPGFLMEMRHSHRTPDSMHTKDAFLPRQKHLAWGLRAFYLMRVVILPWFVAGVPLPIAAAYVSFVCGAVLTFVFVVSHNFEDAEREPCKGEGPTDWYKAQIETSSTYGGWWGMLFTGGLNLQIEHHCFPRMSSWHYPAIQSVVRECCEEHGVRYAYFPYLWTNVRSTWRYMQKVGVAEVLRHAHED
eukprot:TRINITY_DN56644_c0_g1_i1.p1 TRINITY_DN56644_c0_g1~~TRINITY_DN56644_c0_g1_i1.p1  ORF type:complete len:448 (+),score=44.56 TRINITY_DN56644_c0_g1_i1:94-1437(+)